MSLADMCGRLLGKVAVVTGTGDGIGRTTALRFASEGARVVCCDINPEKAAETCRLIEEAGGEVLSIHPIDLMDEAAVNRMMKSAEDRFGGIDILAHYAMVAKNGKPDVTRVEDFDFTLRHVVTMSFIVCKHVVPFMRSRGQGAIVLTGSVSGDMFGSGFTGNMDHVFPYAVAKGAVIRMGIAMANAFGRHGIRVNIVSPGPVDTPNAAPLYGREGTDQRKTIVDRQTLLGRISLPEDIAKAAVFLASDDAANITGVNLHVDGGYAASGGTGSGLFDVEQTLDAMFGFPYPSEGWLMPNNP